MRGDQLVLQPRGFRALEASPEGLTMADVAMVDAAQGTARKESPAKAYSNNWGDRLFCYKGLNQ